MRPARRAEVARPAGRRRAWWWPLAALAAAASTTLVLATTGGFTAAVADAGDRLVTGSLVTAAASGGATECDLGAAMIEAANTAGCGGALLPPESLPASGVASTSTTVTDRGSLPAAATSLASGVCGPVQLADATTPGDPMLVRGARPAYGRPGPLPGSSGVTFDGSTDYAADVTAVPASATATAFSVAIWFKATGPGGLIGLADTPSVASPHLYDKMLFVDDAGHVVMATYNGALTELTSPGAYADGAWHLAVGTFSTTAGMALYVDGAPPVAVPGGRADFGYSGYWHIGWEAFAPYWADAPAYSYLSGTLSDAATFATALSGAQVAALRASASQAAWAASVQADGATGSWALADDGTSAYAGAVPGVSAKPCAFVDVTVGVAGGACAAPAAAGPCPAPSSALTLAGLSGTTTTLPVALGPGRAVTVTVTLGRDPSTTVASNPNAAGLDLTVSSSIVATDGGFSASLVWPGAAVVL